MNTNYEITIRWNDGDDVDAIALQKKVSAAVREIDPHASVGMFGNSETHAGSTWLAERRAAVQRTRERYGLAVAS